MRLSSAIPLLLATMPATALELGTPGGHPLSFEGLLQGDAIHFDEDASDLDGGTDERATAIRRFELVLEGEAPWDLDWVLGYDAKAERWLDVNLSRDLGPGRLRIGQFKQPNGLEELSSTKNNDFISKAAATNAFAVSRRLGVAYAWAGDAWTLTGSVFGREMSRGGSQGSGHGLRATFAPVQGDGRLLHLGLSWMDHDTDADQYRLRARPQADLAARRLVDSGVLADADRSSTAGFEAAWVSGPLKLQGEWFRASVDRLAHPDYSPRGGYLSALWNLGGASWGYKAGVPTTPLPEAGGSLWQAGLRLDRLDLDHGGVPGGTLDAATLGVNWYRGAHFKAMLDYVDVRSERQGLSDDPDMLELRLQLHW
jgi:phosphate-selective porin OprO/OprP